MSRVIMQNGPPIVSEADLELRARTRVGTYLLDKWRLDGLLGMGGMASVFAATHRNGNRVAIKLLHPELGVYPEVRQRFLAEGYAANKVGHPGAVSVQDDGLLADGSVFLVMELLEGETLDARVRRGTLLSPLHVVDIGVRLLDVLAAAHSRGIIHRDIKPENVFLVQNGDVKVLDFGIASAVEGSRPRTTRAGTPMGTPGYMPPEQARGRWELVDARSDLWAAGATMFFALSQHDVHEGDGPSDELLKAMTEKARPLKSVAPLVPEVVTAVVDRALAFDREDRWPDARAMQAALREAAALLSAPETEFTPVAGTRSSRFAPHDFNPDTLSARPVAYTEPPPLYSLPPPAKLRSRSRARAIGMIAALAGLVTAAVLGLGSNRTPAAGAGASPDARDSIVPPPPSAPPSSDGSPRESPGSMRTMSVAAAEALPPGEPAKAKSEAPHDARAASAATPLASAAKSATRSRGADEDGARPRKPASFANGTAAPAVTARRSAGTALEENRDPLSRRK
jgi:serine/threonine-protein kinase